MAPATFAADPGNPPMSNPRLALLAALTTLTAAPLAACDKDHQSGAMQKATGHVESAIGELTGNDKLKREGKKDAVVGGVKSALGDVKDTVKDAAKR
jgi:uncharacterized protein YjbJ (UPF0337 family)